MNNNVFRPLFQAACEVSLLLFAGLLVLDQWLPNFAQLSVRLDILAIFVVFCGVVFFLQSKKSSKS